VVAFWEDLKADEKPHRTSVLDGVPRGMPALALAQKLLAKAEKVGVGIGVVSDDPVAGSGATADAAVSPPTEDELGRVLFELAASARAQGLDAERALRAALRGFEADVRAAEAERTDAAAID
jgi:XTP/dITP diphosphohydrolase